MITQERLKELVSYDPQTGKLTWRGTKILISTFLCRGYFKVTLDKKSYGVHQIAWLYVYGLFPKRLDHKSRDKTDNRIDNLRLATQSQNMANTIKSISNMSGFKGVCWNKSSRKWVASIRVNGKAYHLGYFRNIEDAAVAYKEAAKKYFGEFANA